jgi:hypothetical protein
VIDPQFRVMSRIDVGGTISEPPAAGDDRLLRVIRC